MAMCSTRRQGRTPRQRPIVGANAKVNNKLNAKVMQRNRAPQVLASKLPAAALKRVLAFLEDFAGGDMQDRPEQVRDPPSWSNRAAMPSKRNWKRPTSATYVTVMGDSANGHGDHLEHGDRAQFLVIPCSGQVGVCGLRPGQR